MTTVLNAMNKPALKWAAARETAVFSVTRPDAIEGLSEADAINRLARHHDVKWGGAAAMGTLLHSVNEAWTWGEEADLEQMIVDSNTKAWAGREDTVLTDLNRYVNGLEKFWLECKPETIATEEVVRHVENRKPLFIGQRDWVANVGGRTLLIDIKTSSRQPADGDAVDKGTYFDSWRVQLAAYRGASNLVNYDADGNEVETFDNYPVEGCAVLHLRGDDEFTLWECRAGGDEFGVFKRLLTIHEWMTKGHKQPAPTVLASSAPTEKEVAA